jgi:hypothetical protein
VLLTRSPLGHLPEGRASLDLHVLSTPPAFVLSQDQTLHQCLLMSARTRNIDLEHRDPTGWVTVEPGDVNRHKSCTSAITKCARLRSPAGVAHGFFGADFWHTVEFSRDGRAPVRSSRTVPGQPANAMSRALAGQAPVSRPLPGTATLRWTPGEGPLARPLPLSDASGSHGDVNDTSRPVVAGKRPGVGCCAGAASHGGLALDQDRRAQQRRVRLPAAHVRPRRFHDHRHNPVL